MAASWQRPQTGDLGRELHANIAARADEIETARRVPNDLALAMARAGYFKLFAPQSVGGLELPPREGFGRLERLATADASAAWTAMIGSSAAIGAAYLGPEERAEIFGGDESISCGVFAPSGKAVEDGADYVVTGRWQWGSGSPNADWMGCGCCILQQPDDQPDPRNARIVFFRKDQVELLDTWHVMGLSGTGSGDIAVKNVRVPRKYSYSVATDPVQIESPLFRLPYFGTLALGIGAVALGNAGAAIDDLRDLAISKVPQGSAKSLAQKQYAQATLAEAQARFQSARAYFYQTIDAAWSDATRTGQFSPAARADLRLASTFATRTCAEVVGLVHEIAGGSSVYLSSPLQRRLRDSRVMTQHMMVARPSYELVGRILFGLEGDYGQL